MKKNIRSLSKEDLRQFFISQKEKPFRGDQVYEWLWKKSVYDFNEMTNIPLSLRNQLADNFAVNKSTIHTHQQSNDGTLKNVLKLCDGNIVEFVIIPKDNRNTLCISSQVGCSLNCKFCATAKLKRIRNLEYFEIYDQVILAQKQSQEYFNKPISNIVFMGMGEPLMNYENLLIAIQKITQEEGLGLSHKRITVSTSGIPHTIKKVADQSVKFNLAVSLHSAIQEKREKIMPFSKKFNLESLLVSLQYWYSKTKTKITFEYIVFKNINDTIEDINALVSYCKKIPCKVNIIEYNPIGDDEFLQASSEITDLYVKKLNQADISATIRKSRGKDIDAACGQLANKVQKNAS